MAQGKSVLLVLDKERHLRYDFNALADLDQALGLMDGGSLASLPQDVSKMRLTYMRAFIWAGLLHEDPRLTQRGAGELVQQFLDAGHSIAELADKLLEALELAGYAKKAALAAAEGTPAPLADAGSQTPST